MKMTPEQKAFFEYGELFQLWKDARRCVFWHEESHEDIRREIVQKVWQKRAECRAWVPLERRECKTCRYLGYNCPHTDCIPGRENAFLRRVFFRDGEHEHGKRYETMRKAARRLNALRMRHVWNKPWIPIDDKGRALKYTADAAGENTDVNPHNSLENAPAQVGETLADGKEGK